jgi:hypothetical protein
MLQALTHLIDKSPAPTIGAGLPELPIVRNPQSEDDVARTCELLSPAPGGRGRDIWDFIRPNLLIQVGRPSDGEEVDG